MTLGYERRLFVLALDRRGSLPRQMFGFGAAPTPQETATIADAKSVIFDGFSRALSQGAPSDTAGILVDEQYGAEIARVALARGCIVAMPVERSDRPSFEFEYGDEFGAHIEAFGPTFSKVLVRFNPEGDATDNRRSIEGLEVLSDWLHSRERKLLLELLVLPEAHQVEAAGGQEAFVVEARPALMRQAIATLQTAGIEADIWKIEGVDRRDDCRMIADQARAGGRERVGCLVLGAGASEATVHNRLRQAAGVPGYLGFAVGRTIWWDPITGYVNGALDRDAAAAQVSANYRRAIDVYLGAA
jgi:myo-inositol catabolism protein IolC